MKSTAPQLRSYKRRYQRVKILYASKKVTSDFPEDRLEF